MGSRSYWVYILTNAHDSVLYIGVTGDIQRRTREHKEGAVEGFTQQYNLTKLVYMEEFAEVEEAIGRKKQLKNWKREWKEELIRKDNPAFSDLREKDHSISREIPHRSAG